MFGHLFLGQKIQKFFLVGKGTKIAKKFEGGECVHIGPNCYIGPNVKMGNFVLISDNVNFIGTDHVYQEVAIPTILAGRPENYETLVTIVEDDVWIGHGVTIMRGIKIGEGSIIGANSIVTENIPPYSVYVGIPAKFIKSRFTEIQKNEHANFLKKFREGEASNMTKWYLKEIRIAFRSMAP